MSYLAGFPDPEWMVRREAPSSEITVVALYLQPYSAVRRFARSISFNPIIALWEGLYYYPNFIDEEVGAQSGKSK